MLQTHDAYGIFLNETGHLTKGKINVARLFFYPWEFKKINMISCCLILTLNLKLILRWFTFSRILPKTQSVNLTNIFTRVSLFAGVYAVQVSLIRVVSLG